MSIYDLLRTEKSEYEIKEITETLDNLLGFFVCVKSGPLQIVSKLDKVGDAYRVKVDGAGGFFRANEVFEIKKNAIILGEP